MWIRLILPLFLLLQPVYSSKTHVCARCVDEGAKVVESRWHSASYMRLLYNDSWPTCSKRNNVTSSIGCFRVRMSKGMVPHGAVYEMQGPMSSLLTVNGYDLREYTIQGNETVLMLDKTQFEFYFCQSATCFLDVVMPPDPHLLPYSQKRLPSLPTTSTTFPLIPVTEPKAALVVAAKPAPSLPSAFQALMNPWVIAFMFVVAFVSGSLALLLAFALALRWEKKVLAKRASLPLWQIGYPRIERSPVSSTDGTIGEYSDSSSNSSTNSKMFGTLTI